MTKKAATVRGEVCGDVYADRRWSKPPRGSDLDAAQAWAQLGETNKAFALMEQAYAKRGYGVRYLKVDPNLDPLRSDPRFEQLLQRVGLAE